MFWLIAVFFFALFSGAIQGFSYDLSDRQYQAIDRFEEKLFSIIDERESVTPEKVQGLIENILEKRKLSEQNRAILEVVLDDLQYVYYLWEYGEVIYTQDDCYENEYFDEVDQRCYFDDGEYDYENETDFLNGDYKTAPHGDESEHEHQETAAEYKILGNEIELISGTTDQKYEATWSVFSEIIPLSVRSDFKLYKIVEDPDSDTLAHVEQDQQDNTKWNMTVNIPTLYDGQGEFLEESIATLIHEFAHVLTLNKTQVRYYSVTESESILERFAENCQTNLLQEWCLSQDAYLDDFIDIFWQDAEYTEKVRNEEIYAYDDNPSHFITDYAATNPGEDIAESFTYFVLNKKPTGSTVADKKLLFFYTYKELENLRIQIRTNMAWWE